MASMFVPFASGSFFHFPGILVTYFTSLLRQGDVSFSAPLLILVLPDDDFLFLLMIFVESLVYFSVIHGMINKMITQTVACFSFKECCIDDVPCPHAFST